MGAIPSYWGPRALDEPADSRPSLEVFMRSSSRLAPVLAAAVAVLGACSSGSTDQGRITIRLVDAPSPGYQEVNVDVRTVEIATADGWVVLGTPDRVINLLALTGGVSATLVDGATLPAGHYGQLRLILGPDNSVKLADGSVHDLKVPSGQQSGLKLTVHFEVQPGTTADVYIDFDAHRSVFVHAAGNSGKYILRPTVRAFWQLETGSIAGPLVTAAEPPVALPFTTVTAQTVAGGVPAVVRSTTTDELGRYVLDLLPLGQPLHVVAQPVIPGTGEGTSTVYAARASAPITLTAAAPTAVHDAAFAPAFASGAIGGTITRAAVLPEVDTVEAWLDLDAGGATLPFVVRSTAAVVDAGLETYAMPDLPVADPASTFTVLARRRGLDPTTGAEVVTSTAPATVTVAPGEAVTADLAFP
jgi:hypothetical protein